MPVFFPQDLWKERVKPRGRKIRRALTQQSEEATGANSR